MSMEILTRKIWARRIIYFSEGHLMTIAGGSWIARRERCKSAFLDNFSSPVLSHFAKPDRGGTHQGAVRIESDSPIYGCPGLRQNNGIMRRGSRGLRKPKRWMDQCDSETGNSQLQLHGNFLCLKSHIEYRKFWSIPVSLARMGRRADMKIVRHFIPQAHGRPILATRELKAPRTA